jgi:threonine/homoserine/homoserine lactone efflux protein
MMFDYTLAHWSTFFVAAILLNLTPGPDIAYVLVQTVRNGKRSGFAALFGVWSGLLLHVLFAALGLSAIIATSATAFVLVKWAGALYLIWLGIQTFRSNSTRNGDVPSLAKLSNAKIFRRGVLVATLNPKVAFFFLAFLPQFVVVGAGPASAQLFLHGFLILVVGAFIEPLIIIFGANLTGRLQQNPNILVWMERGLGAMFIGLGVRIGLTEQS